MGANFYGASAKILSGRQVGTPNRKILLSFGSDQLDLIRCFYAVSILSYCFLLLTLLTRMLLEPLLGFVDLWLICSVSLVGTMEAFLFWIFQQELNLVSDMKVRENAISFSFEI